MLHKLQYFPKKKKKPRSWGTTNEKFHIHQQCRESLLGRKETQDRGSEHKNHTTAFQVAHKEVPNQAGFLPGCSTSPQFLKPSNSTKTRSILSYRRVLASPLHTAQTTQAGGKTQKLYQRPDSKRQLRWVREEKKGILKKKKKLSTGIEAQNLFQEFGYSSRWALIIRVNSDTNLHPSWITETL